MSVLPAWWKHIHAVDFHFIKYDMLVTQLCPTLCDPMDCSPPGSSFLGILQARILVWVAIPFSRRSSQSRDQTCVPCIVRKFVTIWITREAHSMTYMKDKVLHMENTEYFTNTCIKLLPSTKKYMKVNLFFFLRPYNFKIEWTKNKKNFP